MSKGDKNQPFLSRESWKGLFDGWHIVGCAVRTATIVQLVARKTIEVEKQSGTWDHDIPARLVTLSLAQTEEAQKFGWADAVGFNLPRCGVSRQPLAQGLMLARNSEGSVLTIGGRRPPSNEAIGKGLNPAPWKIKCIGDYAYSVGQHRKVYKRADVGRWVRLDKGLPKLETEDQMEQAGFTDMHGPGENDLYAVGGQGDVWRYDGKQWKQCDFPSNEQLGTVTVGPDGKVYISGEGGNLWIGAGDTWKQVHEGESSLLFNNAVWFQDQLWLCSDYQLRVWDGKEVRRPRHDGKDVVYTGHMDAYDGLLVVAGLYEVHAFDGKAWRPLVEPYK
jgi:hypothetical protein